MPNQGLSNDHLPDHVHQLVELRRLNSYRRRVRWPCNLPGSFRGDRCDRFLWNGLLTRRLDRGNRGRLLLLLRSASTLTFRSITDSLQQRLIHPGRRGDLAAKSQLDTLEFMPYYISAL